jgi:ABC-type multidrug transport system ATPase subunit
MDRLSLRLARDRQVRSYSRGMRQQLGFVGALMSSPDVVLLDEPGTAIDPENTVVCQEIIAEYQSSGGAVLFTSHTPALVQSWAATELSLAGLLHPAVDCAAR